MSILKRDHVNLYLHVIEHNICTRDTPNVSHLARERGKTGKSTARIASVVIKSMCARYTVKNGRGASCGLDSDTDSFALWRRFGDIGTGNGDPE